MMLQLPGDERAVRVRCLIVLNQIAKCASVRRYLAI